MGMAGSADDHGVVLTRELVVGLAGVVVAYFAAVVLSPDGDLRARVVVMAVACGVLAALLTDWRAVVVVAVVSVGVFVGVLADGVSASGGAWGFTPLFVLAVLLGVGNRRMRAAAPDGEHRSPPR